MRPVEGRGSVKRIVAHLGLGQHCDLHSGISREKDEKRQTRRSSLTVLRGILGCQNRGLDLSPGGRVDGGQRVSTCRDWGMMEHADYPSSESNGLQVMLAGDRGKGITDQDQVSRVTDHQVRPVEQHRAQRKQFTSRELPALETPKWS